MHTLFDFVFLHYILPPIRFYIGLHLSPMNATFAGIATFLAFVIFICFGWYLIAVFSVRFCVNGIKELREWPERRRQEKARLAEEAAWAALNAIPPFLRTGEGERLAFYSGDHVRIAETLGGARYAYLSELAAAGLLANMGIPIGQALDLKAKGNRRGRGWLRYNGQPHILTIAPTGSGKARDSQLPALLSPIGFGNVIAVDPKGQLSAVTRTVSNAPGHKAYYLNPFDLHSDVLPLSTAYNPLLSLDPKSKGFGAQCDAVADLVVTQTNANDPHWNNSGQKLVSGFIAYLCKYKPAEANLVSVRMIICSPPEVFVAYVAKAMATKDQLITERLSRFTKMNPDDKEVQNILSTAQTQTDFIGNDAIRSSLGDTSIQPKEPAEPSVWEQVDLDIQPPTEPFTFRRLRKELNVRVFLILPAEYLDTCSKWFRLVVGCAIRELMEDIDGEPVTMMLDECYAMQKMKILQTAMGLGRGYKLRLWQSWQDLNQIKDLYGDAWQTFLSNSVQQYFAPRDLFTAKYLEERCGQTTISVQSTSVSESQNSVSAHQVSQGATGKSTSINTTNSTQGRPLLYAQDIIGLPEDVQLLFVANVKHPIFAGRTPYWNIRGLEGRYDADPYHKGQS